MSTNFFVEIIINGIYARVAVAEIVPASAAKQVLKISDTKTVSV